MLPYRATVQCISSLSAASAASVHYEELQTGSSARCVLIADPHFFTQDPAVLLIACIADRLYRAKCRTFAPPRYAPFLCLTLTSIHSFNLTLYLNHNTNSSYPNPRHNAANPNPSNPNNSNHNPISLHPSPNQGADVRDAAMVISAGGGKLPVTVALQETIDVVNERASAATASRELRPKSLLFICPTPLSLSASRLEFICLSSSGS